MNSDNQLPKLAVYQVSVAPLHAFRAGGGMGGRYFILEVDIILSDVPNMRRQNCSDGLLASIIFKAYARVRD